jgi:NAD(P)-dependent dehydrogenase (short-subunit alcohol dehydrogenase family)
MNDSGGILHSKVIILIGGAGLIGRSFAEALVGSGGVVVIADRDYSRAQEVCVMIRSATKSSNIKVATVDITSKDSLDALIENVMNDYGHIDAVVNCAYPRNKNYGRKADEVEYKDFCENVSMHLGGYFLSTQRFARHFKSQGWGHVINISSIYGSVAPRFEMYDNTSMTMAVEYAAIKSAIQHISVYFTRYYKGTKLRFNCISPGGIYDNQPESFLHRYKNHSQYKGMLDADDIVGTLIFLLSDLSQYINGQNIVVDDGFSL